MIRSSLLTLLLASSCTLTATAQEKAAAKTLQLDEKLSRYHQLLLKRPESTTLFQRFQTKWLASHDQEALALFLKTNAADGSASDKQLYSHYLLQQGNDLEALKLLTEVVKQDATNAQALYDRAKCYARVIDFEKAILDLNMVIKHSSNEELTLQANKLIGRYLTRTGDTDAAIHHWKTLAKDNPKDTDLIEDVIDILSADGLFKPAYELAENLKNNTKDPYRKALHTLKLADILQKKGDQQKALGIYTDTLKISGNGSWLEREIIGQLETIYRKEDNINGWIEKLESLSKTYPQRYEIHQKHALSLAKNGDFDNAKTVFKALLKTRPDDVPLRVSYLSMLREAGDTQSARKILDFLIEKNPNDTQLIIQRAELYDELDNREAVLENINLYKSTAQKSVSTSLQYAELLNRFKFEKEAAEAYKASSEEYPESADAAFSYASFLLTIERLDEAKEIWKKIASTADKDTIVRLLDTLLTHGQPELALEVAESKFDAFNTNIRFLHTTARVAEVNEKYDRSVEIARKLLYLAKKPSELDNALSHNSRIIIKSKKVEEEYQKLKNKGQLSVAENCLLIDLAESLGKVKEANSLLEHLTDSKDTVSLLQCARIYEKRFQLDKSAEALETLISQPDGAKPLFFRKLVSTYDRAGLPEKAIATAKRWKTLSPNDKNVWLMEVQLIEESRSADEALRIFRRGIERFEDQPDMFGRLAGLYTKTGNHTQAMQLYWRLYDDSQNVSQRLQWANLLAKTAQSNSTTESLLEELNRRRRTNPKSIAPLMALSEVYRENQEYEKRRNLLLEATRLKPNDVQLLLEIAKIDNIEGRSIRAIEILTRAQKIDTKGIATKRLAQLYMDEGEYQRGLAELTKLQKGGSDARDIEDITMSLMKQYAHEEAQEYLAKHIPNHPNDWRLLFLSCLIDQELGFPEKAFKTGLSIMHLRNDLPGKINGWKAKDIQTYHATILKNAHSPLTKDFFSGYQIARILNKFQPNNNRNYNGFSAANNTTSNLPQNIEGIHSLTKFLLVQLLDDFSIEQQEKFTHDLNNIGIINTELYKIALSTNIYQHRVALVELLRDMLDDDEVKYEAAEIFVFLQVTQGNLAVKEDLIKSVRSILANNPKTEYLKKIADNFYPINGDKDKYMDLFLDKILKKKTLSADDMSITYIYGSTYFNSIRQGNVADFPSKLTKVLERYVHENKEILNPKKTTSSRTTNFGANSIAYNLAYRAQIALTSIIMTSDRYPEIIKEIEKPKFNGRNYYRNLNRISGFNYNQFSIRPITFPPSNLTSINNSQVRLFLDTNQATESNTVLDKKQLKEHLDLFKNPMLKALATQWCDPNADFSKMMQDLQSHEKYKNDALILEASWLFNKKKNLAQAVLKFEEARNLSIDRAQRQEIEESIVSSAFHSDDKLISALDEKILDIIKGAARRKMMSRSIITPQDTKTILRKFNMENETARFLTKNNTLINKSSSGFVGIGSTKTQHHNKRVDINSQIKKDVDNGKRSKAISSASKHLKSTLAQNSYSLNYIRQTIRTIQESKIDKDVLKVLDPRESKSPSKWLTYYKVAEALNNKEIMKSSINFLSSLTHTPQTVRTPIALAIYKKNPKQAGDILKDARIINTLFSQFAVDLPNIRQKPQEYLKSLEFLATYIESKGDDRSFIVNAQNNNMYQLMREIQYLVAPQNNYKYYESFPAADKKSIKRLDKALVTILKAASYDLYSGEHAFLMLTLKLNSSEPNTITKIAKDSLMKFSRYNSVSRYNSIYSGRRTYNNPAIDGLPDRINHLIKVAIENKDETIFDDALLESMSSNVNNSVFKIIKQNLFTSDSDFLTLLTNSAENTITSNQYNAFYRLAKYKGNKKHKLAVARLFLAAGMQFAEHKNKNNNDHQQLRQLLGQNLQESISVLIDNGFSDEMYTFLEDFRKSIKTGGKSYQDYWIDSFQNYRYSGTNLRDPQSLYVATMQYLATRSPNIIYTTEFAHKQGFPIQIFTTGNIQRNIQLDSAENILKQLKAAKFLAPIDEISFTMLPQLTLSDVQKAKLKQQGINERNPIRKYYIEILTNQIKSRRGYSPDRETWNSIKKTLSETKGKEKFSANLLLLLIGDIRPYQFLKENKDTLKSAPKKLRNNLSDLFNIDQNREWQKALKEQKLEDLFPIDKQKLLEALNKEVEIYLKRTTPFTRNEIYSAESDLTNLMKKTINIDTDLTYNVLEKYIDLYYISIQNLTSKYYFRSNQISNIQHILSSRIFDSLKRSNVSVFKIHRLLYKLQSHPKAHLLNITELLNTSVANNWMGNYGYNNKGKSRVVSYMKDCAKHYNTLTNEDEKQFHKAAWIISQATHTSGKTLNLSLKWLPNNPHLKAMIENDPTGEEFYKIIAFSNSLEVTQDSSNSFIHNNQPYNSTTRVRASSYYNKNIDKLLEEIKTMPAQYKVMAYNCIAMNKIGKDHLHYNNTLKQDAFTSLIETLKNNPNYAVSSDIRHVLSINYTGIKLSNNHAPILAKALEEQIEHLNKNEKIHVNQFIDTAILLGNIEGGANELSRIIIKKPKHFKNLFSIAEVLLKQGDLTAIPKIISSGSIDKYHKENNRMLITKSMIEHLPALLKKYSNPTDKLFIKTLIYLNNDDAEVSLSDMHRHNRIKLLVADYLKIQSDSNKSKKIKELLLKTNHSTAVKEIEQKTILDTWKEILKDIDVEKTAYDYVSVKRAATYMITHNMHDEYIEGFLAIHKKLPQKDHHQVLTKVKNIHEAWIGGLLSYSIDQYIDGNEEELRDILPILRKVAANTASVSKKYRCRQNTYGFSSYSASWNPNKGMYPFISVLHHELDEEKQFDEWLKSLDKKQQAEISPDPASQLLLTYSYAHNKYGQQYLLDGCNIGPFLAKIMNSSAYQNHLVNEQKAGSMCDYLLEYRVVNLNNIHALMDKISVDYHLPLAEANHLHSIIKYDYLKNAAKIDQEKTDKLLAILKQHGEKNRYNTIKLHIMIASMYSNNNKPSSDISSLFTTELMENVKLNHIQDQQIKKLIKN